MKTGEKGIDLITHFEGCYLDAYKDAVGIPTIGYGHIKNVHMGMTITQEQAIEFLKEDLAEAENAVEHYVNVDINQDQFDALVSWVFNLGSGNLSASTMLKRINAKEWQDVPYQIQRWNKAGGKVLKGLVRRRAAEALLWQSKDWKFYDDYDNAPSYKDSNNNNSTFLDKLSDKVDKLEDKLAESIDKMEDEIDPPF